MLILLLHGNIDQTHVNLLHGLLKFVIGGLDCRVITTEYISCVNWIHLKLLFRNALVLVKYSVVSDQYSYTILLLCLLTECDIAPWSGALVKPHPSCTHVHTRSHVIVSSILTEKSQNKHFTLRNTLCTASELSFDDI